MIEDSVVTIEHGPQKTTVEDAMKELGMDFKQIQKALADRGIEMTNIKKKIPVAAIQAIQRGETVIAGIENENLHWIPKAFIDEFGENCVSVSELGGGKFWVITVKIDGRSTAYTFLKSAKQLENNKPTDDLEAVNKAIHMVKRMFKMVNDDVSSKIREIYESRNSKGVR